MVGREIYKLLDDRKKTACVDTRRLGAFISKKYIQCSYKQHTGRRAGEKHEALMKTITARRRAMNPPMIIDDERRKMSKLGEEKGGALS